MTEKHNPVMKILLELRPAFEGHAGIPQETRLLFRGLNRLAGVQVDGMLQSSQYLLAKGLPADPQAAAGWPQDKRFNRQSRVVISARPGRGPKWHELIRVALRHSATLLGSRQSLGRFEAKHFSDFIWRALFAKTLPASDFDSMTAASYRVMRLPWGGMHRGALLLRHLFRQPIYPRLDTRDYQVFIAETPYPGRVSASTQLVVRYHDAIPILMPHSITDRENHQASHYQALRRNVEDGAWFACVSDATRQDLITIFPQVANRAVTIHNMVSHHYYAEESSPSRIPDILLTRRSRTLPAAAAVPLNPPRYLLMVSTIEPRKNHLALLSAWEQLRNHGFPNLRLVFVGALGWDHKSIVEKLQPWLQQGGLHVLEDVPADELRLLYRHAEATVCPSFGEGFDFSGVEAMRCGSIVAASDIPVHRDIYADAAEYFTPYAVDEMARVLAAMLGDEAASRRDALRRRGAEVAARYLPEKLLPQWQTFFDQLAQTQAQA
jgi:glycosyltransferase involved in cell wall biosynthesis